MANETFNPLDRRSRTADHLSNLYFHVMDVSLEQPIVLSLAYGFKSVSAPSLSIKHQEIKRGNYEFPSYTLQSASVGPITLEQGVKLFNSDFYDWISTFIPGKMSTRRNLLLIQYASLALNDVASGNEPSLNIPGLPSFISQGLSAAVQPYVDIVARMPARAWLLVGCVPTEYKSGSDFDALGAEVSIAQLTIQPEELVEFNLGI